VKRAMVLGVACECTEGCRGGGVPEVARSTGGGGARGVRRGQIGRCST
jgi:hypothetical protein